MKYQFLLKELVKKEIKLKYRRSKLGILWTLIEPLLTMIVLTIVFGTFFGKGDKAFPVYILTGRLLYSYFNESTRGALRSIRRNAGMIKKVYIPKYIYPLAGVISSYIIFLISLIVLIGVAAVLQVKPTIYIIGAVVPLFLIFIMSLGVGMILSTLAVFFRDLEYLWGVICMLIMYTCAIFYKADKVINTGNGWIFKVNPLYAIIANFRNCVLYGQPMDTQMLMVSSIFSFSVLIIGFFIFYKNQDKFILHI
ncbi:MAG: ABC transporter permease [Lachnospiraceae bacterium]